MPPKRKISIEQLEILVESCKNLSSKPKRQSNTDNMILQEKWLAVSNKLNTVKGGAVKSPKQWRRYFIEWTSKCRKRASDAHKNSDKKISFNDTEIRLLQTVGITDITQSSSVSNETKKFEHSTDIKNENSVYEFVFADDFNTEEIRNSPKSDNLSESGDDDILSGENVKPTVTPPPQWALDLEERRVASQEKMADALQSIASTLRSQEQKRELLDIKLATSLTALASKIQDLTSGIQVVSQDIRDSKNNRNKKDAAEDKIEK